MKDATGKGIAGVVVYDSQNFTSTDKDGRWELRTDTAYSKFICISTPADYQLPQKEGLASDFYVPVGKAVREKGHDFHLEKRRKPVRDFYYIAVSDPQIRDEADFKRWKDETTKDLRHVTDSLKRKREVVGMTLGDLVFDNLSLYPAYADSWKNMGLTSFQCIGNHDFDRRYQALNNMRTNSARYGEQVYGKYFGPTDYSFNIGKVHVITLNNINYLGGYKYVECLTDRQIAWLEKDLSFVPKGTTVIVNMHAAGWNKVSNTDNMRNPDRLLDVLKDYRVHMFCGHTHYFQNVEVNDHFYQHNIGAACGAWWVGNINRCGAPNGYMIVDVKGDSLQWQYKSTGLPLNYQFKVYAQGNFGSQRQYVVANVWDVDSKCRVEWLQDGKPMGKMERFTDEDDEFRTRYAKGSLPSLTTHLFRCRPVGKYHSLKVVFTNRFRKTFSQSLSH